MYLLMSVFLVEVTRSIDNLPLYLTLLPPMSTHISFTLWVSDIVGYNDLFITTPNT